MSDFSTNKSGNEDYDDINSGCECCGQCGTTYYTEGRGYYCDDCLDDDGDGD